VRICVFRRWAGDTLLWIFAVFWRGSPELLGWPGLAGGGHPLITVDPLMGALQCSKLYGNDFMRDFISKPCETLSTYL
jgi:hypothetical protein